MSAFAFICFLFGRTGVDTFLNTTGYVSCDCLANIAGKVDFAPLGCCHGLVCVAKPFIFVGAVPALVGLGKEGAVFTGLPSSFVGQKGWGSEVG